LIQFKLSRQLLAEAGTQPGNTAPLHGVERLGLVGGIIAGVVLVALGLSGVLKFNPGAIAKVMAYVILGIAVFYFAWVFLFCGLSKVEKERVAVIVVLVLAAALFWSGFEQAGSSLNLFAERSTDRQLSWINYEVPAAWFQSFNAIFIILLAPVFAGMWGWLARRSLEPSIPWKFGFGLILLAAGFFVMAGAAKVVAAGSKALPTWLITTYLLHTFGELCLSPVGLSSVTKLAPRKLVGQLMGIWFLGSSFGNLLAGLLAGEFKEDNVAGWAGLYLKITILPIIAGLLLIACVKPIKRWMEGVK
jgi:POT family proton-dependent oligopeptide transporter